MSDLTSPASSPAGKPSTQVRVLPHAELCPEGLVFEARPGRNLAEELIAHGVAIEHACDMVCACATCHVHLREGAQHLQAASDDEEDSLGDAWGLDAQSRLSCCVRIAGPALVVELPRYTKNHARER
jgi:2Fe-2S ferredoxin